MSNYKIVIPSGNVTNLCVNPSIETATTGWTLQNGASIARSSTYQKYGAYSLSVTTAGHAYAGVFWATDINVSINTEYYVSVWVYGVTPGTTMRLTATCDHSGAHYTGFTIAAGWQKIELGFTTDGTDTLIQSITIANYNDTDVHTYYVDALNVTQTSVCTTYIDGDQPGCEWSGTAHASTSTLSGSSRAGGIVYDMVDDLSFTIESVTGLGAAPRAIAQGGYAQLPGGRIQSSVRTSRAMLMAGIVAGDTEPDYHAARNALWDAINPEAYPQTADGWQPVQLRYTGAATDKKIYAHYVAGMEGQRIKGQPFFENVALSFSADDPNFYEIGDSAAHLDTNDSATLRYVAGRLKSTGQWDDLGLTANPTTHGTIRAICVARDHSVYIGGDFTGLNGVAGRDYVARYTPSTDTWSTLVGASDLNGAVLGITEGANGNIYLFGVFTAVNGVATADYVVVYTPSTDTWSSLGDPDSGAGVAITNIYAGAFDSANNLYVVGDFDNFSGVANADGVAMWNGAAWSAIGAPAITGASYAQTVAIDNDDNVFVGGSFTNCGGDANADYWAWWDGSAWAAVDGIALNGMVHKLVFDDVGDLYVAGAFTDAGGVTEADYIFKFTGTAVEALGSGLNAAGRGAWIAPDGVLWVYGQFTTAGDLSNVFLLALWNGSSWTLPDIKLDSNTTVVYGLDFDTADSTVNANFTLYIGCDWSGTGYFAGDTTVTNAGTAPAYPDIVFKRSGGTSARLISVRNWTTGKELYFDYSLLDGETLTISTHPDKQSAESSFFGSRADAVLEGSDIADFCLLPGANLITAFVDVAGAPTITAYMLWQDAYDGIDD